MLWDVTDKDLDRMCLRLWEHLSEKDSSLKASSAIAAGLGVNSSRSVPIEQYSFAAAENEVTPADPDKRAASAGSPDAPSESAVVGNGTQYGDQSRNINEERPGTSLAQALERGRLATKLKSLTGAAAVLYGLPLRALPLRHASNILLRSRSNVTTKH